VKFRSVQRGFLPYLIVRILVRKELDNVRSDEARATGDENRGLHRSGQFSVSRGGLVGLLWRRYSTCSDVSTLAEHRLSFSVLSSFSLKTRVFLAPPPCLVHDLALLRKLPPIAA